MADQSRQHVRYQRIHCSLTRISVLPNSPRNSQFSAVIMDRARVRRCHTVLSWCLNSGPYLKVERILNVSAQTRALVADLRIDERTDLRFFRTERKLRSCDEVLLCRALVLDEAVVIVNLSRERNHACEIEYGRQ